MQAAATTVKRRRIGIIGGASFDLGQIDPPAGEGQRQTGKAENCGAAETVAGVFPGAERRADDEARRAGDQRHQDQVGGGEDGADIGHGGPFRCRLIMARRRRRRQGRARFSPLIRINAGLNRAVTDGPQGRFARTRGSMP